MAKRSEIYKKDKWDIEKMYPDEAQWDEDIKIAIDLSIAYEKLAGSLGEGAEKLLEALELNDKIWLKMEKAYVYSRMRKDEDNREPKYQAAHNKARMVMAQIDARSSWFIPEVLGLSDEKIQDYYEAEPKLLIYKHYIDVLVRHRKHTLSVAEETLLANYGEVLDASSNIFNMINDADMTFQPILVDGTLCPLTHGSYITFMEHEDKQVRKQAFEHMYEEYKARENTLATTYGYAVNTDVVTARVRKYDSVLDSALSQDKVPRKVYTSLIDSVHSNLDIIYKYMRTRKRLLGLDELHMSDIYVPLIRDTNTQVPFQQGVEKMTHALSILGEDYISTVHKGIEDGWVDRYENVGKTSGAYSFGCYDSNPYILMNYKNKLKDVFTLVHEMGHSMHSYYTRNTQPFVYGSHSIFTAEVASTVNECLLIRHLLAEYSDDLPMRKYLLNMHIEEFRTTLIRQTMFAEFELLTHTAVESGETLTAQWLCSEYEKLNSLYFGPDLAKDDLIRYEWARIPHFYRPFYVYKYATGYSAANAISAKILKEGSSAVSKYREFLTTGASGDPIDLLKIAGVDMSTTKPIDDALAVLRGLVDEFDELTS